MITAILILIGIILICALIIFIMFKSNSNLRKDLEEKESVNQSLMYNNQQLRILLNDLNDIDKEGRAKIEKAKNIDNANIANELNNKLSNSSGKS